MTQNKKPSGCIVALQRLLSGFLALLATGFLLIVIAFLGFEVKIEGITIAILSICGFAILRYFWKKVGKNFTSNSAAIKTVFFDFFRVIAVFILFIGVMAILMKNAGYEIDDDSTNTTTEEETTQTEVVETTEDNKSVKYIVNKQGWKSFDGQYYFMDFKIAVDAITKSNRNRLNYRVTNAFSWGDFYKHMADHDKPLLEHLYTAFSKLQRQHKMGRKQFAEFIITSIQDIPYNYIKSTPCNGNEDYPCVGNIKLGIYAPVEFGANLKGDCDSRTVLLFVLLSKFNFDVAILNSNQYRHSVLGISLPSRGKYKTYNRKKYYFVETTSKGCPIGYLPKEVSNTRYWNFVLVN